MLPHQPGAVLAVREAVLEEHPEAIQALVAQHVRATEMLENDPAQAAPYVREFVGKRLIDEETVTAALSSPSSNYLADPHMIIDATRTMADFQRRIGTLKKPVDVDALFDTSVYDAVMSSTENAAP